MTDQKVSHSDVDDLRYIQEHEQQINDFFKQMQFKLKDFNISPDNKNNNNKETSSKQSSNNETTQNSTSPESQLPAKPKPAQYRNYRGQVVLPIEKLRENYEAAIPGTKWLTLPYCRRTILGKVQFWCGASFIFTYMWGSYYMRKNNLKSLSFKQYRNAYGVFALSSIVYVFAESIFFEPYCDINSYHYKPGDNLFVARDIKKQLKELTK